MVRPYSVHKLRNVLVRRLVSGELRLKRLAAQVRACRRCPGLNAPLVTQAAPGYGSPRSRVVIVGQSLCRSCMVTQIPFTGGCGRLLDSAFALAGLQKEDLFTTNVVHCHPPHDRPSQRAEILNCSEYLAAELEIVRPNLVVGLGRDAAAWLLRWSGPNARFWSKDMGVASIERDPPLLFLLHHPSYMMRRPGAERSDYSISLANALSWAFHESGTARR